MNGGESQDNLAQLLAGNEEMISRHYQAYAEKFTEHRVFWDTLAREELEHAQWIRDLYAKAGAGGLVFNEERFDRESLREFRKHLDKMLAGFRAQATSMREALQDSLSIEKMLFESRFFEAFSADSPDLKAVLEHLARATRDHRARIEQFLKQF